MHIWNGAKMPTIGMIERHCEVGNRSVRCYADFSVTSQAVRDTGTYPIHTFKADVCNLVYNRAQMIATGALPSEL